MEEIETALRKKLGTGEASKPAAAGKAAKPAAEDENEE
jgi:hypothetical protein